MKRTASRGRGLRTLFPKRKGSRKRIHGRIVGLFAIAAVLLGALNVAVILTPTHVVRADPTSPIFVSAGAGDELSATLTTALDCPYPSGLLANDLIILQVGARGSQAAIASIAGFTRLFPASGQDAYLNANQTLWYRFSSGAESGNVSINLTAAANSGACRMYAFRGVATSSFTEAAALTNFPAAPTVTGPTVATTGNGRLAVVFAALDDQTGMGTFSGETGGDWVEPVAEYATGIGSNFSLQLQTANMPSGGTISGGTAVYGDGSDDGMGRSFALIGIDSAPSSDNMTGWGWSDTGGWLSMNSSNAGSGGGSYGVNFDTNSRLVTGWAWSENSGWVCFGSTCTASSCANGAAAPFGGQPTASLDASVTPDLQGWAMFCNIGAPNGWISLNCATSGVGCGISYFPSMSTVSGNFSGYAWHALGSPLGWGWIDFALVRGPYEQSTLTCRDTVDNDDDGPIDCADNGCYQQTAYNCPANERTECGLIGNSNCCGNGLDDDNDGGIDCSDSNCSADPLCVAEICDNGIDDNSNTFIDCADIAGCSGFPACTPSWIRSNYGSIYAQAGVGGNAPPAGQSNASYCITSAGTISNFTSAAGCVEASQAQQSFSLPNSCNGYVTTLGKLDVSGILAGRYGAVTNITSDAGLPQLMAGKVYVYDRDAQGGNCPSGGNNFNLNAKTFNNAVGSNGRGNGTLVVKGCDIQVTGNLSYQAAGVSQYLRNMASFGIIALAKYSSCTYQTGGNVYFGSGVTQSVGMVFAERSIHSGSTGGTFTDVALDHYGALVSKDIKFERRYGSPTEPAEEVIFDGRGVVNPPPGMQDVTKSLPTLRDTF